MSVSHTRTIRCNSPGYVPSSPASPTSHEKQPANRTLLVSLQTKSEITPNCKEWDNLYVNIWRKTNYESRQTKRTAD